MKGSTTSSMHPCRWLMAILLSLGLLRLVSLGLYPLADTTEARYGNIARLMAETGDWITPQYSLGVPFWGKPPLSTWLSAAAMKLFGINEFAARLPSFLLGLAVVGLVWSLAVHQRNRNLALAAAVVLASSGLFFVSSGAVMTDPSLLLGTTLCMVAFWQALAITGRAGKIWGYAFFVGLAIGLLAKGPVAVVLTGFPIGIWVFWKRQWVTIWQRLPWCGGLLLTAILSLPWYWLAELKTPGFLDYFLVGEHWQRFTVPGWTGDLYGNGHRQPKGTIWLFWLVCALPWSLLLPAWLLSTKGWKRIPERLTETDGWLLYLVLWGISPMVLFTLASNILWTYVLPGLPAFALLTAEFIKSPARGETVHSSVGKLQWASTFMLSLFGLALVIVSLGYGPAGKSQKELIVSYEKNRLRQEGPLVYLFKRPYSAEFYSRGKALLAQDLTAAEALLQNDTVDYFVIRERDLSRLPAAFHSQTINLGLLNGNVILMDTPATAPGPVFSRRHPQESIQDNPAS